ncbi:GroES-like protein [Thozetella sp. PMI_491]|nr:GroES-like protein [Thozetella sp. PMI_491]
MAIPATMRAVIQGSDGQTLTPTRPTPQPREDEVLVRVHAVAINPCDWKMPTKFPTLGASSGSDFAGVVAAIGSACSAYGFRVGDRVASAVHGANPGDPTTGAFADYVCSVAALTWKIPAGMSFTDAAAVGGCGIATVGLALFTPDNMGLRYELDQFANRGIPSQFVLVYGGSTATGTMAIQILKLCGYRVVTTCSPNNFALVQKYGAEKVFDHRSVSCAADIKAYTLGSLRYTLDVITDARSVAICEAVIGRGGGRYVGLEALPPDVLAGKGVRSRSVRWTWVLGITLVGRGEALGEPYRFEYSQDRRDFGHYWFHTVVQDLVDRQLIKPHPPRILGGGLTAAIEGVEMLKKGQVRGEKLIYPIIE